MLPPPGLAPTVTVALHPLAIATIKVRAANELRTGDLRVLCGVEVRTGVEVHTDELHSSQQEGDIALKVHVASDVSSVSVISEVCC
jgi:hypothetical protein